MYDEDTQSSSDCFVESAQKIIDLLDDCINIDADPQKIDSIRTSISTEQARVQEFYCKPTSGLAGLIFDLSKGLKNTMDWIGQRESTRREAHFPREDGMMESVEYALPVNLKPHKKTHIQTETEWKPHVCDICGTRFTQPSHFMIHSKTIHGEDKSQRKPYACDICNNRFSRPSNVNAHKKTHLQGETARKPYVCDVCGSRYTQAASLKHHKRSHLGDDESRKPHACASCDKRFASSKALNNHKKTHLNTTVLISEPISSV
ncbi:hypothetical protein PRIPAC_91411, partial [Pristionchus pacificus]